MFLPSTNILYLLLHFILWIFPHIEFKQNKRKFDLQHVTWSERDFIELDQFLFCIHLDS